MQIQHAHTHIHVPVYCEDCGAVIGCANGVEEQYRVKNKLHGRWRERYCKVCSEKYPIKERVA